MSECENCGKVCSDIRILCITCHTAYYRGWTDAMSEVETIKNKENLGSSITCEEIK